MAIIPESDLSAQNIDLDVELVTIGAIRQKRIRTKLFVFFRKQDFYGIVCLLIEHENTIAQKNPCVP